MIPARPFTSPQDKLTRESVRAGVVEKNVPTTAAQKEKIGKKIHMDGAVARTYVRRTQRRAVTNKHTNKRTFLTDPAPYVLKKRVESTVECVCMCYSLYIYTHILTHLRCG